MSALSPLDGRYRHELLTLAPLLSEEALIAARAHIEIQWLLSLKDTPLAARYPCLSPEDIDRISALSTHYDAEDTQRIKDIEHITHHDVKAVEYWLRERLNSLGLEAYTPWIHFACTSEDINNLAYALLFRRAHDTLYSCLDTLKTTLITWAHDTAELPMLSRTHGQSATPTTLGKEIAVFAYRLELSLQYLSKQGFTGKMNGAVGNFNAAYFVFPEYDWHEHARDFVQTLGFDFSSYTTQVESKDALCRLLGHYVHVHTILLDCCRDLWQYISLGYFSLKKREGEIGSSTMPHKINPIDFENAEGNLGLANALMQHCIEKLPISRLQRDLSDSTVMRNIGVAFGHAYLAYRSCLKGLNKLSPNTERLHADLYSHWEVLTEAVQSLLRARGHLDAYEMTKDACQPQMSQEDYQAFITSLPLSPEDHKSLIALTPNTYLGIATTLAKQAPNMPKH